MFRRWQKDTSENDTDTVAVEDTAKTVHIEVVGAKLTCGGVYPEKAWIVLSMIGIKMSDIIGGISVENKTTVRDALFLGDSSFHKSWVFHGIIIILFTILLLIFSFILYV
jgi:hypothetical protein